MRSGPLLVAGIGNVFFGDDGFGPAVIGRLRRDRLPAGVEVADFGIRGVHLAYEILEAAYRTVVLVDALPMGEAPGTLAVVEVEGIEDPGGVDAAIDAHSMTPGTVLSALAALQADLPRVIVVGCQPGDLCCGMALTQPVEGALDAAARLVAETVTSELAGLEVG